MQPMPALPVRPRTRPRVLRTFRVFAVLAGAAALAATATPRAQAPDPTIASIKLVYDGLKDDIVKSAAMVPEDKYGYQPTPEVRTFGRLFGHIANAGASFCAAATGMKSPIAGDAETLETKAELQKAVADMFAFCDHAFMMITPANANETVTLFGQTHSRLGVLAFNNAHLYEHYGNLVTYLRLNGMVPPSSQGGGGNQLVIEDR
ncbi:MAG: DinB family protein [Vicinamibacterales bacterium]